MASYTLSNILASGALTAARHDQARGSRWDGFPNSPSDYAVTDDTTPAGSGTVTAALSGGGTNAVTFTVPNNIEQGDELTLKIADVVNPTVSSSTDAITLVGAVTNLPPTALRTTPPIPNHSLAVSLAGTGSGSVAGTGITCPTTCAASYQAGTIVTLTATPSAGSTFQGWSGACTGTAPCQLTMSSDQAVTAIFASKPSCTLTPMGAVVFASARDAGASKPKKQPKGVLE